MGTMPDYNQKKLKLKKERKTHEYQNQKDVEKNQNIF